MASLVQLVGIKRQAETESGARVDLGVVGQSGDTTVVELDLKGGRMSITSYINQLTLAKDRGSSLYLLATSRPTELLPRRS